MIEDTKILEKFEKWLKESTSFHDEMLPFQKYAEQYYLGNQTDRDMIPDHRSKVVENRIFESVETLVPVATAAAHQFLVSPGSDTEISRKRAEKFQKVLSRKYQTLEMQRKLEDIVRHFMLYRFGVAKWGWNHITDDVEVWTVDPRLIFIPKLRVDAHDLPYKIEAQEYTEEELEDYFPDIKIEELVKEAPLNVSGEKKNVENVYRIYEVWTNEWVAWISSKKVLTAVENPYWDFKGEERTKISLKDLLSGKMKRNTETVFRNHLKVPTDPYVFFTTYKISEGPVAPISLVEVGIPVQDAINDQKRRIIDNLRQMGNGQVYVDSDAMSQEEADNNITNEPGLVIRGEGVASLNKVKREPGVPLPNGHFSNLQHSEAVFDNIMGIHSATRGQAQAKTLGQDILSRQQDFTRIDEITRVLNRGVARIANGLAQVMKLFYDEERLIDIVGEDGATELIPFIQDDIEDNARIEVRSGQTLVMDEVSQRSEAVQLWQLQAIDPVTLFERLKFPNPEKMAERLLAWKQGQLTMDTMAKIAQDTAAAQSGAAAKAATATPTEGGRAVETPMNVLQRGRASLGGTAPVAPGTPKM